MATQRVPVDVEGRRIELTNLDKLLWPKLGITKADFIHYIVSVADLLLPHLRDRPLTVTRYPDGIDQKGFYQKDCPKYAPKWIQTYPVLSPDKDRTIHYILANDTATLVWLANQAAIEYHPWMSRIHKPQHPDYVVIDLDPGDAATWSDVTKVAAFVRDTLGEMGLVSFPKLSGATGIHIYVPLEPRYTYRQTSAFAGLIGTLAARALPSIATNERLIRKRAGRVYVDHLQNLPGQTIVAAYSPRPRAHAGVSVPFEWDELDRIHPEEFTLQTLDAVLARPSTFQTMYTHAQTFESLRAPFDPIF